MRADIFLVENGYAKTRARAEELIERKLVLVNGSVLLKKSKDIKENDEVKLVADLPFVSRGGDKLAGALLAFSLDVTGFTCLDIGSSTGGFTDCLLQKGAKEVCAVDVGTTQFDEELKGDERVHLFEKTDIRDFITDTSFDLIVGDISFISWEAVVKDVVRLSQPGTKILLLIKPQFEVGKEFNKKGIVTDEAQHALVCAKNKKLFEENGFNNVEIIPSELLGGDGNKEFFLFGERK
jgi:23S rRNA (cytidine1920-2'-O)/16S rRNA (cytidine1409-2'-O)-methyltransferase